MLKTLFGIQLIGLIVGVVLFSGCSNQPGSPSNSQQSQVAPVTDGEMVKVMNGAYIMGFNTVASPMHSVSLSGFYIARHELSYKLWYEVRMWAITNGYSFSNKGKEGYEGTDGQAPFSTEDKPATCMNWKDSIAWCNAYSEYLGFTPVYSNFNNTALYKNSLTGGDIENNNVNMKADGFRLPTEAEWEYAARYIDGTQLLDGDQYSGFNLDPAAGDCAWYVSNCTNLVQTSGLKKADSLGLYDMSGNVREWCWDWFADYTSDAVMDPLGPSIVKTSRVQRGGGASSDIDCLRTSARHAEIPDNQGPIIGLRLVRSAI